MDLPDFKKSLAGKQPPAGLGNLLTALWYDGKEAWKQAHEIVQDLEDRNAALIHAYLHRKEGDKANAGYWYRRAAEAMPVYSLEREWEELVLRFLG